MLKSAILAILVLVATPSVGNLLAQSNDSGSATRSSAGRTWSISELDTLSGHKWIWRDPSFKEDVPQVPDSLPDELPYLKKDVASEYPARAWKQQVEADVAVRVLIDRKGKVRAAYVQMDSGHEDMGFEEAALRVARGSRWEPAYLHDEPMALWVTYNSRFRIMTTSEGDPVVLKWGTLAYPRAAERDKIEDSVQVKVLVDRIGKVRDAIVLTPSRYTAYGFEESALKAAFDTEWKPAEKDGVPTAVWVVYEIRFLLRR
jgi:TonB family protein